MYKFRNHFVIVIGRSFGSGAREIGGKLADELGIPFYDKELLAVEAENGRFNIKELNWYDEKPITPNSYTIYANPHEFMVKGIQENAIKKVAGEGSCVIVGRRADKILRGIHEILSVFISAPLEKRIERVSKRDGLSEKDSKKKIKNADRKRRYYYNAYDEGDWGEAGNYDLCIDSGDLGVDNSAAMILEYLELKGNIVKK